MPARDVSHYLAYLLASANRRMRSGMANSIADAEFTEEHWRILQVLASEQGRSMGELADLVLMNGPALTKNVDRLVSRGLVQRAASAEDSRRVLVFITDVGLETVRKLTRRVDAHHDSIEVRFGPRKTAQLKRLLEQFIDEAQLPQ